MISIETIICILHGSLCFLDLVDYFLSHVREVFSYYLFRYFLGSFLSSPSGNPRRQILLCLMFSQRSLRLLSFLFLLFSLFCSAAVISAILSSRSFIHYSASVILLWIPSSVLFSSIYLFFNSSQPLVNISCIPSVLFLRSWVIFSIIILNSFPGRFPISFPLVFLGIYLDPSSGT